MRKVLFLSLLVMLVVSAEPSVYGNSGSYSSAKKNRTEIIALKGEVAQLKQEIEGLRSIVEGLSQSIGEIRQKEASTGNASSADKRQLEAIETRLAKIEKRRDTPQKSKKAKSAKKRTTENKETKPKADKGLESASSSALYSRGVRLVKKKKYTMAKKRFDILKERGYKKASTRFYLGEIAYRTKNYSDAIEHYKISASTNESANYMDTLLLHTGISLEKRGEGEQAKRFFQAIIDGYPDTGSAKVAKKHL